MQVTITTSSTPSSHDEPPRPPSGNRSAIEAWNTVLFDKFTRFEPLLTEGLGRHGSELFRVAPPRPGAAVLDVGSGFGDTTLDLASRVGPEGAAVGLDCAPNFVRAAWRRSLRARARNVRFRCVDIEVDELPRGFDAVYARFGTMFFASPVVAFRNLRASLVEGGRLAMTVWRRREDNPCFYLAQRAVEALVPDSALDRELVTCGPGPFSMASPEVVRQQLHAAGFAEVEFHRFDAPMCVGRTLEEAVAFAKELGPAGERIRLAGERGGLQPGRIDAALRAAFAEHLGDDGVWLTSSTWIVTATAKLGGQA